MARAMAPSDVTSAKDRLAKPLPSWRRLRAIPLAAGALLAMVPPGAMVFSYDAAVHAVALGFVLSMVFGHAQIVLPVLTGARVRYSSFAYVPLALLHASVVLRVSGDLLEWVDLRAVSAIATILALALYAGSLTFMSWKATCQAT